MSCTGILANQTTANITDGGSVYYAPEPEALRISRTVLFCLAAILSLVGNYVVCRAVWRQPGTKPFAHYLVSNLAFAELLSTVCVVFTFHAFEPPWSWKLGDFMCKILDPLQMASVLVITTTLAIIAFYRCLLMVKPLIGKPSPTKIFSLVIVTWVGSVGLSIPASVFRAVNSYEIKNCEVKYCQEIFPKGFEHYQDIYTIVVFVINFAIPLVIMAVSYALVSKKIKEHIFVITRLRDAQNRAFSSVAQPSTCTDETKQSDRTGGENQDDLELMDTTTDTKKERKKYKALTKDGDDLEDTIHSTSAHQYSLTESNKGTFELENDLLKMVFIIVLIFVICYIPYQVQFLMQEFRVQSFLTWRHRHTFSRLVFTLTCLPSALHPVCYGMMSSFYRKAFTRIIACRSCTK